MSVLVFVALLVQLATVSVALYLVQFSKARAGWSFIIIGLTIILARRAVTFGELLQGGHVLTLSPWAEWLGLLTSTFFLAGLILITRKFLSQYRREQDLELSREHLAALVGSSDDAVITKTLDGTILSWNPAAEKIFGYSADEVIGKPIYVIVPPELQLDERRLLENISRGEKVDHLLTERVTKSGERKLVSISTSPLRNSSGKVIGAAKIARDFTQQRRTEEELNFRRVRLESIIEFSGDAIITKSLQGTIQSWNPAAERIFGYRAEEALGKSIRMLIPPDRHPEEEMILARLARGEQIEGLETERLRKDGTKIFISVSTSPIKDLNGKIIGGTKIARDITSQKMQQDALRVSESRYKALAEEQRNLLDREHAARQQVEQANQIKDRFLATLSHELRTPLNAILGWAYLARNQNDPEKLKEGLSIVERNARNQARIIEDLLDMNRIISGTLRLDLQSVSVPAIIQEAIEIVAPSAQAKQISIESVVDPLAQTVRADPNRLKQMIWNLLVNAVKFTPKQGSISVRAQRHRSQIEIVVSDTGNGISPDFLPKIFDRFSQADASITRQYGGLGLGLSIVRQLVSLHGGSVEAHSDGIGKGASFTLSLPIPAVRREIDLIKDSTATVEPRGIEEASSLEGMRVLVVDDEDDARMLVKALLEEKGAKVSTASSAVDALKLVQEETFDVIVSDIGMPKEDGYDFIRKVRKLAQQQKNQIPAIALSAYARVEDREFALAAGFQRHIAKPVEPYTLIEAISEVSPAAGR